MEAVAIYNFIPIFVYMNIKTICAMGNFVKGAVFGAAAVLLGNYLLNTEEGKETCKKFKDKVKKTADDFKDKLEKELKQFEGEETTSTAVTKQVEDVMEE